MDYSKFYTPPLIASALIDELCISEPHKIIDICCGSCNLLLAAKNKWGEAQLFGVDLYKHFLKNDVIFEVNDGRKYAIDHPNEFDLVLANPPFDFVKSKRQYPELFVDEFEKISTSRLEIEMLIANLKLLKRGGVLMIIMPSSFVEAESYRKIRRIVAEEYYIDSIIKLSEDTFGASRIKSYALIIHNKPSKNRYTKIGVTENEHFMYNAQLSNQLIKNGNWIDSGANQCRIPIVIKRGSVSSCSFISRGQPVLHTAKNCDIWHPSVRFISKKNAPNVWAESGDIIVSRIGKSAGQWCIYEGERIPISDCLYCIKNPNPLILDSMKGKKYNRELKGVATRYITISDFCSWLNSLIE